MRLFLGVVTDVIDDEKFSIRFTIKNYIENCIAYPTEVLEKPEVGDAIVLYEIDDDILGCSFLYKKLRLGQNTDISIGSSLVRLTKDKILLKSDKAQITLDNLGNIDIDSANTLTIKSTSNIVIDSRSIGIKGTTGDVGFNCIPVCPYTNAPHITLNCD